MEGQTLHKCLQNIAGEPWLDGTHFKMEIIKVIKYGLYLKMVTYTIEAGGAIGGRDLLFL